MTTRRDIIRELEKRKMSVRELIHFFSIERKETIGHLKHISKSVLPKKKLVRDHAMCRTCGFVFKDRIKFSTPTKCPECRNESVSEARVSVV